MAQPPFAQYGQAVSAHLRHATRREKAQVQKELTDHLIDHAEALAATGYDPWAAYWAAVEAMGDPEEVGRALDRAYPRQWLILSRLAGLALAVAVVLFLWAGSHYVSAAHGYLQARYAPMSWETLDRQPGEANLISDQAVVCPLDFETQLSGGSVLQVFAAALEPVPQNGTYHAYVCLVTYQTDPRLAAQDVSRDLWYTWDSPYAGDRQATGSQTGSYTDSYCYVLSQLDLPAGEIPTLHYDRYGVAFDLPIPLPWEEVLS